LQVEACNTVKFPADLSSEFFLIKRAGHHQRLNLCGSFGFSVMISKVVKLIQSNFNLAYFANVSLYNEALK